MNKHTLFFGKFSKKPNALCIISLLLNLSNIHASDADDQSYFSDSTSSDTSSSHDQDESDTEQCSEQCNCTDTDIDDLNDDVDLDNQDQDSWNSNWNKVSVTGDSEFINGWW